MTVVNCREIPGQPGAYVLVIDVARPTRIDRPAGPRFVLPKGRYIYGGSAYGPGGIAARVRRHLKRGKSERWHVDRLTNRFGVLMVIALPGGLECPVMAAALAWPGVFVPAPGFGASDCRACPAHLARLPDALDFGRLDENPFVKRIIETSGASGAVIWRR
ncbi:MAG: GIY-YIG nuclease family protein [Rhodospirillales bacterium]